MARDVTPHAREFLADTLTPVGVYRQLAAISPVRFLFESVVGGAQVSRYSFLGVAPRRRLSLWPDRLEVEEGEDTQVLAGEPLERLQREIRSYRAPRGPIPFTGGFVGYLGYDTVRFLENLRRRPDDRLGLPIAELGRYDTVVAFDHARQRIVAVANEIEGEVSAEEAHDDLDRLGGVLGESRAGSAVHLPEADSAPSRHRRLTTSLDDDEFAAAVRRAQEHIDRGDVFQVVAARRFSMSTSTDALALYRALRVVNPSPYMVLLETPATALVGASPEMLVRKTGDRLETRPIAGTRRRGDTPEDDRRLGTELAADEKERAEHLMLVDLGRNDLGRVARPGTVEVASFMELERYSHVMHLVSSVEAEIGTGRDALDALLACFPAGTVSGAPKVRAMELIDELEPEARGPYAGAVGYLSFSGDLDTCITIRTLVLRGEETSVTAGAGIVADSDPAREARESEEKAAALLAAASLAEDLSR